MSARQIAAQAAIFILKVKFLNLLDLALIFGATTVASAIIMASAKVLDAPL